MFLLVDEKDRDLLLWRPPGSNEPLSVYRMNVMIFGAVSSPFTCAYVLRQTANDYGDEETLQEVVENTYVDNWLRSYRTADEAVSGALKYHGVLAKGGFNLTQFAASCPRILAAMPGHQQQESSSINMNLDGDCIERTLGICWVSSATASPSKSPHGTFRG
jgi:hypothetical protein